MPQGTHSSFLGKWSFSGRVSACSSDRHLPPLRITLSEVFTALRRSSDCLFSYFWAQFGVCNSSTETRGVSPGWKPPSHRGVWFCTHFQVSYTEERVWVWMWHWETRRLSLCVAQMDFVRFFEPKAWLGLKQTQTDSIFRKYSLVSFLFQRSWIFFHAKCW